MQDPDFQAECARAREQQADYLFGEMSEIEGRVLSGALDSQAAKVVLSSRQWRASKLAPRTYGDKLQVEQTIKDSRELTEAELDAEIARLTAQAAGRSGSDDGGK